MPSIDSDRAIEGELLHNDDENKVLAWRLSSTLKTDFCVDALEEALARHGTPEIFNAGQESQFTSPDFTQVLLDNKIQISMDGKGRWMDSIPLLQQQVQEARHGA